MDAILAHDQSHTYGQEERDRKSKRADTSSPESCPTFSALCDNNAIGQLKPHTVYHLIRESFAICECLPVLPSSLSPLSFLECGHHERLTRGYLLGEEEKEEVGAGVRAGWDVSRGGAFPYI